MLKLEMTIHDLKYPAFGFGENGLRDEKVEIDASKKNLRWKFYEDK